MTFTQCQGCASPACIANGECCFPKEAMHDADRDRDFERLRAFANEVIDLIWGCYDIDACEAQDLAEKHGLIRLVQFNPDIHTDTLGVGLEAGDSWYVAADFLRGPATASPAAPNDRATEEPEPLPEPLNPEGET